MSTTPLMGLTLPTPGPGGTIGPDWAVQLNANFTFLDSHNHASGSGQKITPAGMSINIDLPLGNNNLIQARSVRLQNLSSSLALATDLNCVYAVNGDLYFNNGSGTSIRLTAAGSINVSSVGTIGGDYSTSSASLSYSNSTKAYTFLQGTPNTSRPAKIVSSEISIYENAASPQAVTLKTVAALTASYSLSLPSALPGATKIVTLDASGNLAAVYDMDNSTLEVSSNSLRIKDKGVTQAKLADRSTGTSVSAGGVAVSDSCLDFSTTSNTPVDVTDLSVTIVTTGRPVFVGLVNGRTLSEQGYLQASQSNTNSGAIVSLLQGSTILTQHVLFSQQIVGVLIAPLGAVWTLQFLTAGTYTFKVQLHATGVAAGARLLDASLVAYEL